MSHTLAVLLHTRVWLSQHLADCASHLTDVKLLGTTLLVEALEQLMPPAGTDIMSVYSYVHTQTLYICEARINTRARYADG